MATYGSLCSGYGGLDLAMEAVFGATPIWHAEVEPAACTVLDAHWPGVPNLGDLTAVGWTTVPRPDVICGGFPCQPFSTAGRRQGTEDDRHLWPHIADALRVLRPRWAVFENVAGHVSLGLEGVLADLASLGFDAEWATVRASDVGAPHRRERLFIVAADGDGGGWGAVHPDAWSWEPDAARGGHAAADTSHVGHERGRGARDRGTGSADGGGVAADTQGHEQREPAELGPVRPEPRHGADRSVGWGDYGPAIVRWEHLTGRPAPHPAPDGRLSPLFVEWMMGLPAGWVTGHGLARTAELKMLGNGVVPQQAHAAIAALLGRMIVEVAA